MPLLATLPTRAALLAHRAASSGLIGNLTQTPLASPWLDAWQFRNDAPAGSFAGSVYEGPGGTLNDGHVTVVDTGSNLSKRNGLLVCAGGVSNSDPRILGPSTTARAAGLGLLASVIFTSGQARFGFSTTAGQLNQNWMQQSGTTLQLGSGSNTWGYTTAVTTGTPYLFLVVLRSIGAHYFLLGGAYTRWKRIFTDTWGTAGTPLYYGLSHQSAGIFQCDYLNLLTVPSPYNSDWGPATARTAAPGAGAQISPTQDALIQATWTVASLGNQCNFLFRRTDDSNCYKVNYNSTGGATGTVTLYRRVSGADTVIGNAVTKTFATSTAYRLGIIVDGNTISTFLDGVVVHDRVVDTTFTSGNAKLNYDNAAADLAAWPLYPTDLPTATQDAKDSPYLLIDRTAADTPSTSSFRPGAVCIQVQADRTDLGTSGARSATNTAISAIGANIHAVVHVGAFGVDRDINTAAAPGTITWTTLDRRLNWLYSDCGVRHLTLIAFEPPAWMSQLGWGNSGSNTLKLGQSSYYIPLATIPGGAYTGGNTGLVEYGNLVLAILQRYVLATGANYLSGVTWRLVIGQEMKGWGYTQSWNIDGSNSNFFDATKTPSFGDFWNAIYDAVRGDSNLNGVTIGGPYFGVESHDPLSASNKADLDKFKTKIGVRTLDFFTYDHALMNGADTKLSRPEAIRRSYEHALMAQYLYSTYTLQSLCMETYLSSNLDTVGTNYGPSSAVSPGETYEAGADYNSFLKAFFGAVYVQLIRARSLGALQWGFNQDGTLEYLGHQQGLFQDTRGYSGGNAGALPAGSQFSTFDLVSTFLANFGAGTALKKAQTTDPSVWVLDNGSATLLVNGHAYSVTVRLNVNGSVRAVALGPYEVKLV